jgi:predicted nucleic acid-binding protein
MKALLDTCVISELVTRQPHPNVVSFVDNLDADDIYLSVITIGEIIKGIEKLPDSRRKTELHDWLQDDLMARFHGNILPLDIGVISEWGALTARLETAGKPMPAIDSLIAATLLAHKMTLITRNVSDFEAAGIEIINPWIESGQQ